MWQFLDAGKLVPIFLAGGTQERVHMHTLSPVIVFREGERQWIFDMSRGVLVPVFLDTSIDRAFLLGDGYVVYSSATTYVLRDVQDSQWHVYDADLLTYYHGTYIE